jgi:hypothetical protein
MLEYKRRAKFRFTEVEHPEDPGVIDPLKHAELAHGHAAQPFALIRGGGTRVWIDPDAPGHSKARMFRHKILPAIALAE